ncbi:tRNA (carboxymethyluridine(34)-5-O)-methyltransferase [Ascoidea rubescens DSM 1968]|uniref:S-adenosyl-L-methionine-dependent methyltransferase n=1 Tax=Ascoidea rubescens DSM 1968 TaxID=1344418 RepID=A0A1D2V8R2_9ASCO|nr:S-adenosyl-L-methionine-dependent methyltransferase [Ascoidea rubescens DSM 1968]ODV58042.1 S-adenosyl-L-methionine-dependent methyltransferase [Ascoidea rubescens DSM 1968]
MEQVKNPVEKEQIYVHQVYNEIASHFSETRYKPWPIVEKFLQSREKGSIGIDVGCGNGKYLNINKNVFIIGSDYSDNLIVLSSEINGDSVNNDSIVCDGLSLPHLNNQFDFAISIAVIHHFSTEERRIQAIVHILSKLKPNGEALIYCWALEQEKSRRGWKKGMTQDVLVPWVLQKKKPKSKKARKSKTKRGNEVVDTSATIKSEKAVEDNGEETKLRYYHLYKENELNENAIAAGAVVVEHGYERDNWWVIIKKPAV